jgi:hypothetical protein
MKPSQPAPTALWLVQMALSGRHREEIIGDILEESRGRSTLWVWRQSLTAILVNVWRDVRDHRVLALRSVLIGTAVLWVLHGMLFPTLASLAPSSEAANRWLLANGLQSVDVWRSRFHLDDSLLTVRWCLGFVATGWFIAKLNRPYATAMLAAYICAIFAWELLIGFGVPFHSMLSMMLHVFVVAPFSVLAGGFVAGAGRMISSAPSAAVLGASTPRRTPA